MAFKHITRPVWAEINLDHLAHNMQEVRRLTKPGVLITAVIKADGYGHGAVEIGQTLLDNGANRFAVATLTEAIQLRRAFKDIPILILGFTPNQFASQVVENHLIQTIYSMEQAICFSDAAKTMDETVQFHIKLDTGMRRIGMEPTRETVNEICEMTKLPCVEIEGIFTHFAVADEIDKSFTMQQVEKFNFVCEMLEKEGVSIPIKHVSNSAAIIDLPELNYNMVRAGIMLYGLYPSPDVKKENVVLKEVMSLHAQVSHVKEIEDGEGVSYGLKYIAEGTRKIASIPIGYADGFTRLYSFKGNALYQGKRAPIVGRICMDQCMVDATGLDINRGDVLTLFGASKEAFISIDEVANAVGTINYEIVCMISKRVPRVYMSDGKIRHVRDAILELQ